jgi:hypothetical protein
VVATSTWHVVGIISVAVLASFGVVATVVVLAFLFKLLDDDDLTIDDQLRAWQPIYNVQQIVELGIWNFPPPPIVKPAVYPKFNPTEAEEQLAKANARHTYSRRVPIEEVGE